MYELKNSILCPYRSFLSYIYKLNLDIAVLLQRPSEENQPKNDKMLSLGQNKEYFQKNSTFKELQTTIWAQRLSQNQIARDLKPDIHVTCPYLAISLKVRIYSAHVDDKKNLDMAMSISKALTGDSILGMQFEYLC